MEYFRSPRRPFDLSEEDNQKAPKNPKDFIMWIADERPSTYFRRGGFHCHAGAWRSLDDTYYLINKRWPMSELEFLDLIKAVFYGNHSYQSPWARSKKILLGLSYCYVINRVVMKVQHPDFTVVTKAVVWGNYYKGFSNSYNIKPALRKYLLKNV